MNYKLIVIFLCVLALAPVIAQAQSYKKNPVLGEVIAYRTVDLISHAKENKYLRQTKIANNIWSTKLPGSSQTLYKGDRGERAGQFCGIWNSKFSCPFSCIFIKSQCCELTSST